MSNDDLTWNKMSLQHVRKKKRREKAYLNNCTLSYLIHSHRITPIKLVLSKANDIKYIIKNPNVDQIYSFVY